MDPKKIEKLRNHLQMAMDCLDDAGDDGAVEGDKLAATDDDGDEGAAPMTGLKMSLSKYK
jgi:hypothetical protein